MDDIKPKAIYKRVVAELNLDDTDAFTRAVAAMCALAEAHQETMASLERCQSKIHEHESALSQAREEGRREGMREAADICEKVLGKRERNPYIDRSAYESACDDCMDAITRAAEGK